MVRDRDEMDLMMTAQQTDLVKCSQLISLLNREGKTGGYEDDSHDSGSERLFCSWCQSFCRSILRCGQQFLVDLHHAIGDILWIELC